MRCVRGLEPIPCHARSGKPGKPGKPGERGERVGDAGRA